MDKIPNEHHHLNPKESPRDIRTKAHESIQSFRTKLNSKDAIGINTLNTYLQAQIDYAKADAVIENTLPDSKLYEDVLAGTIERKRGFCNQRVEQLLKDAARHDQQAMDGNQNAKKFAVEERLEAEGWLILGGTIN